MSGESRRSKTGHGRRGWPSVLLAITVVTVLLASAGSIGQARAGPSTHPPPPPPGGGCPTSNSYKVQTYDDAGAEEINGTFYQNGYYYNSCPGVQVSISTYGISGNFAFTQWVVSGGSIGCPTCTSTTFTASSQAGTIGSISMVLRWIPYDNWAGYMTSGSQIDYASGTFNVPTHTYVGYWPIVDQVGYWVGIGGNGNVNLWQAGVSETVYSDNSDNIQVFYEEVKGDGSCCAPVTHTFSGGIDQGAQIIVDLSVSSGISYYSIGYWNYQNLVWWNGSASFTPDQTTAEWIGEAPGFLLAGYQIGVYTLPNVGQVTFTGPGFSQVGWEIPQNSLCLPILALDLKDSNSWATQYLTPSLLTSSGAQFTINYFT